MKKVLVIVILLLGCTNSSKEEYRDIHDNPIILLYPCNNFSRQLAYQAVTKLENFFYDNYGIYVQIGVEPNYILNDSLKSKKRYNATKILYHYDTLNNNIIHIFLLNEDIFTLRKDKEWGILGQSTLGGKVCVVSTYRIKNKNNLWKVILHEFCHAYFSQGHCLNDDPKCFMKDAKGHARLDSQEYFCNSCKKTINFK